MPSLRELLSPQDWEVLNQGRPECLEHKVYRVPNERLRIPSENSLHHPALILCHKGPNMKYMSGTSIKSHAQLVEVSEDSVRLVVLSRELRKDSKLDKKKDGVFSHRHIPIQTAEFQYFEEWDDFAAAEYTETLLPRITDLKKVII